MGRSYSQKPVKDIETAAETIIPDSLGSSIMKKISQGSSKLSVTANMYFDRIFDDYTEKRT